MLCGVLNYAGCFFEAAGSVYRMNGWEAGLHDGLGFVHDPLQFCVVLFGVGAIPSCDTFRKNAFYYGTFVKIGKQTQLLSLEKGTYRKGNLVRCNLIAASIVGGGLGGKLKRDRELVIPPHPEL